MSPNALLRTNTQRNAVTGRRITFDTRMALWLRGTTESVEERARRPVAETLLVGLTVRVEIAAPSLQPHPPSSTVACSRHQGVSQSTFTPSITTAPTLTPISRHLLHP